MAAIMCPPHLSSLNLPERPRRSNLYRYTLDVFRQPHNLMPSLWRVFGNAGPPKDFAHAFGDALCQYLAANNIGQSEAARLLGIETDEGKKRKGGARIYTYCHDSKSGKRTKPTAEILYLAVTRLPGFKFEYNRYRISAEMLNGNGSRPPSEPRPEQSAFEFMHHLIDTRARNCCC